MTTPNLDPPAGDAKTPPDNLLVWSKLFAWLFRLWKWVTQTLPGNLTYGGTAGTYSAAIQMTAQDTVGGSFLNLGPTVFLFAGEDQTVQAIPNNAYTVITNWTAAIDSAHAFNLTTGIYTVPLSGFYLASGTCSVQGPSVGSWGGVALGAAINKNGTQMATPFYRNPTTAGTTGTTSLNQTPQAVWIGYANAGDTLSFSVVHNVGVSINTEGHHTSFCTIRIGG